MDEVETFCKNSHYLKVTSGNNLVNLAAGHFAEPNYCKYHQIGSTTSFGPNFYKDIEDEGDLFHSHIAISTVKIFMEEFGRAPGRDYVNSKDGELLANISLELVQHYGGDVVYPQTTKIVQEL